ncbi:MAG: hypothetical protein JNN12_02775 [Bacteroidetes Order II. Incertae sedis bacterium]|nr:hypothetical protein [Bacteroidetes Order II. bacterium]
MKRSLYVLLLLCILTPTAAWAQKTIGSTAHKTKLIGNRKMSLQWVSHDYFGTAKVTNEAGTLMIRGEHRSRTTDDYVTINGAVLQMVNAREFKFKGQIVTKTSYINGGTPCVKDGVFTFKATGTRKYWRLQEMENCEGNNVVDYVDIYF